MMIILKVGTSDCQIVRVILLQDRCACAPEEEDAAVQVPCERERDKGESANAEVVSIIIFICLRSVGYRKCCIS